MTPKTQFLVPVKKTEIEVGKPLPWAVYGADHVLLLNSGVVVSSAHQIELLVEKGLFRENTRRPSSSDAIRAAREKSDGEMVAETSEGQDALKLMPGDVLHLQSMVEGQNDRYTVRVIGLMRGKSVLVTAPALEGKLIFVRDGQPFLIRAFSGQSVYAFKARVLKAQHTPFSYLHLSYPDSVQVMRIRKAMRAPAQLIAAISEREGGKSLGAGRIVDISVGGARLFVGRGMNIPAQILHVAFKILLDEHEEYVSTPAVVRSIAEEEDEGGARVRAVGLQFEGLLPQHRLAIMNLVYQHMLKEAL